MALPIELPNSLKRKPTVPDAATEETPGQKAARILAEKLTKTTPTPSGSKVKREFVKDGRENWKKFLDYTVDTDKGQKLRDIIYKVSKETGVRPEVLFTSAMEEGLQGQSKGGKISFESDETGKYIDSYKSLGLDNVGSQIEGLAKSGFLKKDVDYYPFERMNDAKKPTKITPAFFDNLEDALHVKAAFLNKSKAEVTKQANARGLKLSPDAMDFISMQGYNGGEGIIPLALDKYTKGNLLKDESFLTKAPAGSYEDNQTYYNTRKRYDNMKNLQDEGAFNDYYTQSAAPVIQQTKK